MRIDRNMKKITPAATVVLFFLFAQGAWAGTIFGSPHDFRPQKSGGGAVCLPCHVPHGTKTLPAPLWDNELSTQSYVMYGRTRSAAMRAPLGSRPDGLSKICLSCHDGIIAPDAYGGNGLSSAPLNNHPVSFVYDTALAMKVGDLYDPSTRLSGLVGSTGTIQTDMLFSGRMECASCHDVHNTKAVPGTKLLVKEIAGSALCLTCHNK